MVIKIITKFVDNVEHMTHFFPDKLKKQHWVIYWCYEFIIGDVVMQI